MHKTNPGASTRLYFFYGTLIDRDLLALVAGQPSDPRTIRSATLAGYRRTGLTRRSYPILMPSSGGTVDGILVGGLGPTADARLDTYEGRNYRLLPVTVMSGGRSIAAVVYMFVGFGTGLRSDRRDWSLNRWRRRWKRRALRRAGRLRTSRVDA